MPVLKVWNADDVVVLKRSMAAGYAGVPNPLFYRQPPIQRTVSGAGPSLDPRAP